jgi:hypothetical protein
VRVSGFEILVDQSSSEGEVNLEVVLSGVNLPRRCSAVCAARQVRCGVGESGVCKIGCVVFRR